MFNMKFICLLLCAAGTVGCRPYYAGGPDPVLRPVSVAASTTNYLAVQSTLVERAGYSSPSSANWYQVAVAGFGYVDEQCSSYLAELYQVRRNRDHLKNQFSAIGATTNAVLGFTGAGQVGILTTAAAFGLATQLTENVSASLLFAMDPSDVEAMLYNQMQAYRNGAAYQKENYTSSALAMEAVRGYLNLCLPVSIEGQIKAAIKNTAFVATPTGSGAPGISQVQTGSPPPLTTGVPSREDIKKSPNIVRPAPAPAGGLAGGLMAGELAITKAQAEYLQARLCVGQDGDLGNSNSQTRRALRIVQSEILKRAGSGVLDEATWNAATKLTQCERSVHLNLYEHIALASADAVQDVQKNLKSFIGTKHADKFSTSEIDLVNRSAFVGGDRLTMDNREAIKAIQRQYTPNDVSGQYERGIADIIEP